MNEDIMNGAKIAIIGVGGGGNNAVNKMANDDMEGITFIIANTDMQVLKSSPIEKRIILGKDLTKGLGAGANPEIGEQAAKDSMEDIRKEIDGYDLIFVAAGMGGGTGTGAAPIIAKIAKETGALVVGIVTTPFFFEGNRRMRNAVAGLEEFQKSVDSIIIISNDRLKEELGTIPLMESFQYSDAILKQAVRTITDLINSHSLINLDFADVRTVIEQQGLALIGVGRSSGPNKAVEAALAAINSPILESSIEGAKNAIVNIAGSSTGLSIEQAHIAVDTIRENAGEGLDIIFGVTINDSLDDEIIVSVIATGLTTTKSGRVNLIKDNSKPLNTQENNSNSSKYHRVSPLETKPSLQVNQMPKEEPKIDSKPEVSSSTLETHKIKSIHLSDSNLDPLSEKDYKVKLSFADENEVEDFEETEEFPMEAFTNEKLLEFDLFDENTNEFEGF